MVARIFKSRSSLIRTPAFTLSFWANSATVMPSVILIWVRTFASTGVPSSLNSGALTSATGSDFDEVKLLGRPAANPWPPDLTGMGLGAEEVRRGAIWRGTLGLFKVGKVAVGEDGEFGFKTVRGLAGELVAGVRMPPVFTEGDADGAGAAATLAAAETRSANPRSRRMSDWILSSTTVNWLGMANPSFLQRSSISLLGRPSSLANSKRRLPMRFSFPPRTWPSFPAQTRARAESWASPR